MEFGHIVSLGGNCETAHHVRRHFGTERAFPFDWWILPFDAAVGLIGCDLDSVLLARNMVVVGEGAAVQCARWGIVHHHDFERDAAALVVAERVLPSLDGLRAKYAALWGRLRLACDEGRPVLFVRSWREILHAPPGYPVHLIPGMPRYDFAALVEAVERGFPRLDFCILFVNYGDQRIEHPRAMFADVRDAGDITDWTGSPDGWDEMFTRLDIHLAPRPPAAVFLEESTP